MSLMGWSFEQVLLLTFSLAVVGVTVLTYWATNYDDGGKAWWPWWARPEWARPVKYRKLKPRCARRRSGTAPIGFRVATAWHGVARRAWCAAAVVRTAHAPTGCTGVAAPIPRCRPLAVAPA